MDMIYKLINHLKSVSVEGEHGVEYLRHEPPYYENEHVCIEVKEISHNEIQVKVIRTVYPLYKVRVEFLNPMENVKSQLDTAGVATPFLEEAKVDQCYVCSERAVYALGIEKEDGNHASFLVTPNYIKVELPLNDSHQACARILFEKYLTVHPVGEIISRFNRQLEELVAKESC